MGEIVARAVDRLEHGRDFQLLLGERLQPLERLDGVEVGRRQLQQAAVGLDRARSVLQPVLAQAPQAPQQHHGQLGILGQLQLALQVVRQLEIHPLLLEQAFQRAQRGDAAGVVVEDFLPRGNRLVGVADRLFPHGRDLDVDRFALFRALGQLGLAAQGLDQVGPALGAGVQPLQRLQRRRVLRPDLLRALEVLDRLFGVAQLLVVADRDHQQQFALQVGLELLARRRQRVAVQRDQGVPLAQVVGQVFQRRPRLFRAGVGLERLGVGREGFLGVPHRRFQRADAQLQRHALVGILGAFQPDAQHLHQAREILVLLVDRQQRIDRDAAQLLVGQHRLQRLRVRPSCSGSSASASRYDLRAGLLLAELVGVDLAQAEGQLGLLGRIGDHRQLERQGLDQRRPLLGAAVQPRQRAQRLRIRGDSRPGSRGTARSPCRRRGSRLRTGRPAAAAPGGAAPRCGPAPASCRRWPATRRGGRWRRTAAPAPAPPLRCWDQSPGRTGCARWPLRGWPARARRRAPSVARTGNAAAPLQLGQRQLVGRDHVAGGAGLGRQPFDPLARPQRRTDLRRTPAARSRTARGLVADARLQQVGQPLHALLALRADPLVCPSSTSSTRASRAGSLPFS